MFTMEETKCYSGCKSWGYFKRTTLTFTSLWTYRSVRRKKLISWPLTGSLSFFFFFSLHRGPYSPYSLPGVIFSDCALCPWSDPLEGNRPISQSSPGRGQHGLRCDSSIQGHWVKPATPQGPPLSLEAASPFQQSHDNKSGYHIGQLPRAEYCGKTFSDNTLINPHDNLCVWASNWLHTTLSFHRSGNSCCPHPVLCPSSSFLQPTFPQTERWGKWRADRWNSDFQGWWDSCC